jgi:xanthine dehydrogenase accessory factor
MRQVIDALLATLRSGRDALLCQVFETRGSTPQKAGALMLVDPAGGQVGTLGGGCVEAEVKQKAARCLGKSGADVHSFLLDHDHAWADGLVCGGRMRILAQAFQGEAAEAYFRAYRSLLEQGEGFTELIVVDAERGIGHVGDRRLYGPDGKQVAQLSTHQHSPDVAAPEPLDSRPRARVCDGMAMLPTLPRVRLVIVGAGHVGQAVAALAAQADFDVWVIDDRGQYASRERFPGASHLLVGPIDEELSRLEITPRTYALIVTRGHGHDQEALARLAPTAAGYVGLIGSRRKIRLIFDSLRAEGIEEASLARVSAPVGLAIGGESVPEIAISIMAELIARRNLGPGAVPGNSLIRDIAATSRDGNPS